MLNNDKKNILKSNNTFFILYKVYLFLPTFLRRNFLITSSITLFTSFLEAFVILAIYPLSINALNSGNIDMGNNKISYFFKTDIFFINKNNSIFIFFILFVLASLLLKLISNYKSLILSSKIGSYLSEDLFKKEIYSEIEDFTDRDSSLISSSLIIGINLIISSFIQPVFNILQSSCFLLIILISCIIFAPKLIIVGISIIIFIYLIIVYLIKKKAKNIGSDRSLLGQNLTKHITNLNDNFKELFISRDNEKIFIKFKKDDDLFRKLAAKASFYGTFPKYFFESIIISSLIIFLIISSKNSNFIVNNLPILLTTALAIQKVLPYLQILYTSIISMIANKSFVTTYFKLNYRHTKDRLNDILPQQNNLDNSYINCSNISFKYRSNKEYILKNINLKFNQSESLCICGKSGSGKSTLMDIMLGLIKNYEGDASIFNKNKANKIERIKTFNFQSQMSYIPQDGYIYDETLLWNLLPFKTYENKLKEIDKILNILELDNLINKLPKKLMTICKDNGKIFSGGQKQRILIARGLLRNKPYLFADEVTNSLNNKMAFRIVEKIINYQKQKNSSFILITHDESLLKLFDKVYFMNN